ncbi:ubiquitin carboxyl-terminal hydrolase 34-like isoform X2 [Ptychodera flava]|uniref:ubiquitin carboxyl-terminal hydrolase 34-like isoform X2 n=1 Tax=Ptychodera flava TaxID=63121 RepID=UPI00396A4098
MDICDACVDFHQLLQSSDDENRKENHQLSKKEIIMLLLFIQSWPQRQCSCCFRDIRNFDRANNLVQLMLRFAIDAVASITDSEGDKDVADKDGDKGEESEKEKKEEKSSKKEQVDVETESWTMDEKEKLLHCISKVFQLNFFLYTAHKQNFHAGMEDISTHEAEALGNYCDINDMEVPLYLLRNVCFFCDSNGLAAIQMCFDQASPETLPFNVAHALITVVANLRIWLHVHATMQYVSPLRSKVIQYLCTLSDKDLRMTNARNMADMMWNAIKEPLDTPLWFDRESLELAFKYFISSTLTMRLAGLSQITNQLHMFNEVCNNESLVDIDNVGAQLAQWLLEKKIVEHIFGPNLHVEILKQCQVILNFLAAEGYLTTEHIDCIWAAAQLKHSSRYVHDLLPQLIKHLEPIPLRYMLKLVSTLHPSTHTEQTLYMASVLTKYLWTNALSTQAVSATQQVSHEKHSTPLKSCAESPLERGEVIAPGRQSLSSSENSMSAEVSDIEHEEVEPHQCGPHQHHHHHHHHHIHRHHHQRQRHGRHHRGKRGSGRRGRNQPGHQQDSSGENEDDIEEESRETSGSEEGSEVSQRSENSSGGEEEEEEESETDYEHQSDISDADECSEGSVHSDEAEQGEICDPASLSFISDEESEYTEKHDSAHQTTTSSLEEPHVLQDSRTSDVEMEMSDTKKSGSKKVKSSVRTCDDEGRTSQKREEGTGGCQLSQDSQQSHESMPPLEDSGETQEFYGSSVETEVYDCRGLLTHRHHRRSMRSNVMDEVLSTEDISCSSSQASAKSEKNMADFDGEESLCEEELAQLSARQRAQLTSQVQHQLAKVAMYRRSQGVGVAEHKVPQEHQSLQHYDFDFEDVCKKGNTLLWDLVQDENASLLGEGLASEAEKLLCQLVCWFTDRQIRMKFIEGCLHNVENNRSVVVCLRLLPKLFGSFQQYRNTYDTHWITIWADKELRMMEHFFNNLMFYTDTRKRLNYDTELYTHTIEVQARLQFLTCVFSTLGSPDDFRLTMEQVDTLWSCLVTDSECSDEALNWFLNQARNKDQHAMGLETFKHIFYEKMPKLNPETISMTGLNLFHQLCSLARIANSSYDGTSTDMSGMDQLWSIALRAQDTDVSMSAIQYINSFYIEAGNGSLEKEEEFVHNCMNNLVGASQDLENAEDSCLLIIQRGLLLLKTHLETFRKRYAYHLRLWQLQDRGIASHQQNLTGNVATMRVVCQMAGMSDKLTIEMSCNDLVADLRAEVTHWCEVTHQQHGDKKSDKEQESSRRISTSLGGVVPQLLAQPVGGVPGQGPVRMISLGHELTADIDERSLTEMGFKDMQLVFVSFGNMRRDRKREGVQLPASCMSPPPREKLPMMILLHEPNFSSIFSLLQQLNSHGSNSNISQMNRKEARLMSRRVWELLMLLPTSPDKLGKFQSLMANQNDKNEGDEKTERLSADWSELLNEENPQQLLYSLQILEALTNPHRKRTKSLASVGGGDAGLVSRPEFGLLDKGPYGEAYSSRIDTEAGYEDATAWMETFISHGAMKHLFSIFMSGKLQVSADQEWDEWQQDCLACLLKLMYQFGVDVTSGDSDNQDDVFESPPGTDFESPSKKPRKEKYRSADPYLRVALRVRKNMLELLNEDGSLTRLMSVIYDASGPRQLQHYHVGCRSRADALYHLPFQDIHVDLFAVEVVRYSLLLLVSWANTQPEVKLELCNTDNFDVWLRRLVLDSPEVLVRREACDGLYRLCMGSSQTSRQFSHSLLSSLLSFLSAAQSFKPPVKQTGDHDEVEEYNPGCKNYFRLLCLLVDNIATLDEINADEKQQEQRMEELDNMAKHLAECIRSREILEQRHNTMEDVALTGLLKLCSAVVTHDPPLKFSKEGQDFLEEIFNILFALPTMETRYLPKCKSRASRAAAYDLMAELVKGSNENYKLLHSKMYRQHTPGKHPQYPWNYWPSDDGRAGCGFVGLTNLGATCYMASCVQQLYMMPEARAAILNSRISGPEMKHHGILRELQKMFAYLQESEHKAYNPRSFCKVYIMDKQPLNTGEQKDMTEFFTDLISKMEEMSPALKDVVRSLFHGVITNNVVSLDCPHVSRTLEEFYTVRCQVADMKNLHESLDEVTVKDTLEGDNMYTCSQCGKKVRAEKRACFKTLPRILSFNTMRYTFNMITMMKEKVNTHFSFPFKLDMYGYTEEALMSDSTGNEERLTEDCNKYMYDLIGVTVHTGTADGGHYYSFIRDRIHRKEGKADKWYMFNDAEVKPFDHTQIASECFGGEMTTKTYDSVTDKFMDFSFEKTHSAYMLFYERCEVDESSKNKPVPKFELSKDLAEWIWKDNMQFQQDKNIFDHAYVNFMWSMCSFIPTTLPEPNLVQLMAAQLNTTFVLETLIHAKEKPTMLQWIELMTKHFNTCALACEWFLDFMANDDCWPMQILIKCPNQIVRQMFQRLCVHVMQQLRERHAPLYLHPMLDEEEEMEIPPEEIGNFSCVTRFIKRLLSIIEHGAKPHIKHLTEYFSLLYDFARMGEPECNFLLSIEAITIMANFYLGSKAPDYVEVVSDDDQDDDEEEEDVVALSEEKYRPASLEKMIALIATLVEASREEKRLMLAQSDYALLTGGKGFPFLNQQIRDGINIRQTCNLIFSLCRYNQRLAEQVIAMIFTAIGKMNAEAAQPFFKLLSMLVEIVGGPPGMPPFTHLVLQRIWEVAECSPQQCLDWLAAQTPRNRIAHTYVLQNIETWVEHFLIAHNNPRVRNSAAFLLVSLVPDNHFRQAFRSARSIHSPQKELRMSADALSVLHQIYGLLLRLLCRARQYVDSNVHGVGKLVSYFALMSYCLVSRTEKLMFSSYFTDLWSLFQPKLSEPAISTNHNKQALLLFWYNVCCDCPENVKLIVDNQTVTRNIAFNYILADHDDQEVIMFNRVMLPAYYGLLRLCCQQSPTFTRQLAGHQNLQWAFKNLTPYASQYPTAVDELFRLMKLFVTKRAGMSEQEIQEISNFKRATLLCYLECLERNSCWTTLISAFRILIDDNRDRFVVICNHGLSRLTDAVNTLHMMYHEATACHVLGDLIELLAITRSVFKCARVYSELKEIKQALFAWKERMDFARKLLTLLNAYNPDELRHECLEMLKDMLLVYSKECVQTLVPIIHHAHLSFKKSPVAASGPYFPRRVQHPMLNKANIRPPCPELQMCLHHNQVEVHKNNDDAYDAALLLFFQPYHVCIDMLCRTAVNVNAMTEQVIHLSVLVAFEAIPLHLSWFPKLWKDIYHSEAVDKGCIKVLCNMPTFHEFVEAIFLDERACLNNPSINAFFCIFLPKVYNRILGNNWNGLVNTIVTSLIADREQVDNCNTAQLHNIAYRMIGDLRVLVLMCSVVPPKQISPLLVPALKHILKVCKDYQKRRDKSEKESEDQDVEGGDEIDELPAKKAKIKDEDEEKDEKDSDDSEGKEEDKTPRSPQPSTSKSGDGDRSTVDGTKQATRQTDYVDVLVKTMESALSKFES